MRLFAMLVVLVFIPPLVLAQTAPDKDIAGSAAYEVVLQGPWADEPAPPVDRLLFSFDDPRWIRGHDGRWTPTFPVAWSGPLREEDGWGTAAGTRYLHVEDARWVAASATRSDADDSQSTLLDLVRSWDVQAEAGAVASYLPPGARDCFLRPQYSDGLHCQVPGVTRITDDLWLERVPGGSVVHATDGSHRMQFHYEDGVPYAVRVQVQDVGASQAYLVLRLLEWSPWTPMQPAASGLVDLEPVRLGHASSFVAPEDGIQHPFTLEQAVRAALDEPEAGFTDDRERTPRQQRYELAPFLEAYPQAFVYHAEYMRFADDPPDHRWTIAWTNGWTSVWVQVQQDGDPPPLVNEMVFGSDNRTFRYVDPPMGLDRDLPRLQDLTSDLPPVAEMMRYWRAYAGPAWDGVEPNAWGHHLKKGEQWTLWAGYAFTEETVAGTFTETVTTTVQNESYLRFDHTGAVLGYEERVVVTEEGEAYGPPVPGDAMHGIRGPVAHAVVAAPVVQEARPQTVAWVAAPVGLFAVAGLVATLRRD